MNAREEIRNLVIYGPDEQGELKAALDGHQSEVLRRAADLFESACPEGPGPVRFELCQCTAAAELRTMADHPELLPKAGESRG